MRIMDYVNRFKSFEDSCNKIIKEIHEWTEKIKKDTEELTGKPDQISDILLQENSIEFKFLYFNIFIKLDICASKERGFIRWYYVKPEHEEKPRMILILNHAFNYEGDITTSTEPLSGYARENKHLYYPETLSLFCEKVDEIEFNKKALSL